MVRWLERNGRIGHIKLSKFSDIKSMNVRGRRSDPLLRGLCPRGRSASEDGGVRLLSAAAGDTALPGAAIASGAAPAV